MSVMWNYTCLMSWLDEASLRSDVSMMCFDRWGSPNYFGQVGDTWHAQRNQAQHCIRQNKILTHLHVSQQPGIELSNFYSRSFCHCRPTWPTRPVTYMTYVTYTTYVTYMTYATYVTTQPMWPTWPMWPTRPMWPTQPMWPTWPMWLTRPMWPTQPMWPTRPMWPTWPMWPDCFNPVD